MNLVNKMVNESFNNYFNQYYLQVSISSSWITKREPRMLYNLAYIQSVLRINTHHFIQ